MNDLKIYKKLHIENDVYSIQNLYLINKVMYHTGHYFGERGDELRRRLYAKKHPMLASFFNPYYEDTWVSWCNPEVVILGTNKETLMSYKCRSNAHAEFIYKHVENQLKEFTL